MNGPQDLGGQMGFGAVAPEADEPTFHADWEKRALGVTLCAGEMKAWSIDESRHARESLHPADYYRSTYYEIWIKALEVLLARHGFVTPRELAAARALDPAATPMRVPSAEAMQALLAQGSRYDRPVESVARFSLGDRVRTKNFQPLGHTRLPRHARGKVGVVEAEHGGFVFPDSNAHKLGEAPQRLYTVKFTASEIWGEGADQTLTISIDAWESYLEPA